MTNEAKDAERRAIALARLVQLAGTGAFDELLDKAAYRPHPPDERPRPS